MNCPACGGARPRLVTRKLRFGKRGRIWGCAGCGSSFLDPRDQPSDPGFYATEYHGSYLARLDPDVAKPAAHYRKMRTAMRVVGDRLTAAARRTDRVLEVGCATGHNLMRLRPRVRSVAGIEPNRREREFCRRRLRLDVRADLAGFAGERFSLILLVFVLEHIPDPVGFLRAVGALLAPGGRLVIIVPSVSDPLLALYDLPRFAEFYHCREHATYFSPRGLAAVLWRAGYAARCDQWQEYPLANHLSWCYRGEPAEPVRARNSVPPAPLRRPAATAAWNRWWRETDRRYRRFLATLGYGDRLLAVARRRTR